MSKNRIMRMADAEWRTMQEIAKREKSSVAAVTRRLWARAYPQEFQADFRTGGRLPEELEEWGWMYLNDGTRAVGDNDFVYLEESRDEKYVYLKAIDDGGVGITARLKVAHYALLMGEA